MSGRRSALWRPLLVAALAALAGFLWIGLPRSTRPRDLPPSAFDVVVHLDSVSGRDLSRCTLRCVEGFRVEIPGTAAFELRVPELELRSDVVPPTGDPDQTVLGVRLPDGRRAAELHLSSLDPDGLFHLEDRLLTGSLEVSILSEGRPVLSFALTLPVEHYLAGVIGPEISPHAPLAALEAQAIASRSYVAARTQRGVRLSDTTGSQVFRGLSELNPRVLEALRATAGQVLSFGDGVPATAFYHSTCGGKTANGGDIFRDAARLRGVDSDACEGTQHFRWTLEWSAAETKRLVAELGGRGSLAQLEPVRRDGHSARWVEIRLRTAEKDRQDELVVDREKFRTACSRAGLRSPKDFLWFEVVVEGGRVRIDGGGFGHGVGMCQMCARGLADRGWTARQILERFYPDARIHQLTLGT